MSVELEPEKKIKTKAKEQRAQNKIIYIYLKVLSIDISEKRNGI